MKSPFERQVKDSCGSATEQRKLIPGPGVAQHTEASSFRGQQWLGFLGHPGTRLWGHLTENGLPPACAVCLISGCQSLLRLPDLLDKIAGGRKYQKVWVIKTLSCNIIKGILKSMTSIWKDIFHGLSSTVQNVAEQKWVMQGGLLMKVLVEKAARDKMS